ncbi:hypothetical protein [Blastococcus sp. TF02-8]|uniref:hypothetical protein n=1 Tax=Blastococcus sp. TF02-8 TaxID=2250574 RepID=UPI000DE9AF54|nr:hypothetical protein [Blastococcus sp. TF02-8]
MVSTLVLVAVQVLQLLALRALDPRFFWLDDSQAQFGPTAWWLGTTAVDGRPALMDPGLGSASNLVADIQYGVLDPWHWLMHRLASSTDNMLLLSWGFASACLLLLGVGTLWLLLCHHVRPALAVAGAVGVASSGFLLWYGGSWWPVMWSVAWLPWLWLGLSRRGWLGALLTGVAAWVLLTAGNPYLLPFAALLVAGQVWEWHREGGWRAGVLTTPRLSRLLAGAGGVVLALPTLLSLLQASSVMQRQGPEALIGNEGFGVTNLADVLVGGATLMGQTNAYGGDIGFVPAMATALFAVPAVMLVSWRRALHAPGVLTALVVFAAAVLATQLPTTVGAFRYPFRYLVVVQVALPVLVLIALAAAPAFTRSRLALAASVVAAQLVLAVFRAPVFLVWHVLAAVLTVLCVFAVARVGHGGSPRRLAAGAAVVLLSTSGLLVGVGMMLHVQERADSLNGQVGESEGPLRALYDGEDMPTTVAEYRAGALAPGDDVTVIGYNFGPDGGWSAGAYRGNGNLVAGMHPGYGSIAVGQAAYNDRWCHSFDGITCSSAEQLLGDAPTTGQTWVDLMSADTVFVADSAPEELLAHFRQGWTSAGGRDGWSRFEREDDLPGRVTAEDGVTVGEEDWYAGPAFSGHPMDRYTVSTGDRDGSIVLRVAYWPGLRATLDGRDIPVDTVDGALVRVAVPADVIDGDLRLYFEPIGDRILWPAMVVGALIILAGAAASGVVQLRGSGPVPVEADAGAGRS